MIGSNGANSEIRLNFFGFGALFRAGLRLCARSSGDFRAGLERRQGDPVRSSARSVAVRCRSVPTTAECARAVRPGRLSGRCRDVGRRAMRLPDAARCGTAAASCGMSGFSSLPPALPKRSIRPVRPELFAENLFRPVGEQLLLLRRMAVDQRKQSDQQRCRRRSAQKRRDPTEAHCFPPRNRERLSG